MLKKSASVKRHWALTDSRPFTNLTCIILHVVNLIMLRVADLSPEYVTGICIFSTGHSGFSCEQERGMMRRRPPKERG